MTFLPHNDPLSRFKAKVVEMSSGCHEWQSTVKRDGYGQFWHEGKPVRAHRVAYLLLVGPIPAGKLVLHRCDNKRCVNPAHLYAGTHKENTRDIWARGRSKGRRKLSDEAIRVVLRMRGDGQSQQSIADAVGVDQTVVSRIVRGVTRYSLPFHQPTI